MVRGLHLSHNLSVGSVVREIDGAHVLAKVVKTPVLGTGGDDLASASEWGTSEG